MSIDMSPGVLRCCKFDLHVACYMYKVGNPSTYMNSTLRLISGHIYQVEN